MHGTSSVHPLPQRNSTRVPYHHDSMPSPLPSPSARPLPHCLSFSLPHCSWLCLHFLQIMTVIPPLPCCGSQAVVLQALMTGTAGCLSTVSTWVVEVGGAGEEHAGGVCGGGAQVAVAGEGAWARAVRPCMVNNPPIPPWRSQRMGMGTGLRAGPNAT